MYNNRIKLVIVISIIGVLFIFTGSTYAIFSKTITSDKKQVIKAGAVKLELNEPASGINLSNFTALSDSDGLKQEEFYSFSVKNVGDVNAKYKLMLVDFGTNSIDLKYVKVGLELNGKEIGPFNLSEVERIINEGLIEIGKTNNYKLRLWLDSGQSGNLDALVDKMISLKIKLYAEQYFGDSLDNSGANAPMILDNMIPVYFEESDNTWRKADASNINKTYQWYDYSNKMWANAVTVTSTNRNSYLNAPLGTKILLSDINTMWVWIPRYKYTYFASSTPVEIPITFEKGTTSTGTIKCTDAIAASSGKSEVCTDATNGSLTVGKSTYTHPAFTFGDNELTGLWVGKFESGGGTSPVIKPSVVATGNKVLSTYFQYARNMELSGNVYGFSQSGTALNTYTGEINGDSNKMDTHAMKNSEWGVVTYLSHSKYGTCTKGTCSEVSKNPNSSPYTGGGNSSTAYVTNKMQSTTLNVYGIYDMSGGMYEYTMGNMQNESNLFNPHTAGVWSSSNKPFDKYYDKYTFGGGNTEYYRAKLGDAIVEMKPSNEKSWYLDHASLLIVNVPWFLRGGGYSESDKAGLFYFGFSNGTAINTYGYRTVLAVY